MSKNPYIRELSSISSRHLSSNSRQISNISRQPSSFSRRLSGNSRQLSLEDLFLTPQFLSQLSARQQSIVGLKRVDIRYSASGSRRDGHFMKVIKKKVAPVEKETTAPATTVTHDKRYRVLYVFVADAIWIILMLWMNFLFIYGILSGISQICSLFSLNSMRNIMMEEATDRLVFFFCSWS